MGIPVTKQIPKYGEAAITLTASPQNVLLPVPARAFIMGFRAVQLSGTLGGFSVTLYEKKTAADPDDPSGALSTDAELYRVTDTLTVAPGSASGEQKAQWTYYENKDPGYNASKIGPTNRAHRLFAHFVVSGGVAGKTFGFRFAFEEPTNL